MEPLILSFLPGVFFNYTHTTRGHFELPDIELLNVTCLRSDTAVHFHTMSDQEQTGAFRYNIVWKRNYTIMLTSIIILLSSDV